MAEGDLFGGFGPIKKRQLVDCRLDYEIVIDVLSQICPQAARTRGVAQPTNGFFFNLSDPLAR